MRPTPRAPYQFNRDEEQVYRDLIRQEMMMLLPKNQLPLYPGMQSIVARGTDAAFEVPSGAAPLYIPLETIAHDTNDPMLDASPHTLKAPYTGYALVTMVIDNVATGAGGSFSSLVFRIYKNGVEIDSNTLQMDNGLAWRRINLGYLDLAKDDEIKLYMDHNKGSDFVLDLTKSSLAIIMLTPNPLNINRSRIS